MVTVPAAGERVSELRPALWSGGAAGSHMCPPPGKRGDDRVRPVEPSDPVGEIGRGVGRGCGLCRPRGALGEERRPAEASRCRDLPFLAAVACALPGGSFGGRRRMLRGDESR